MTSFARLAAAATLALATSAAASAQTLYDGLLGTTPGAQGWDSFTVGSVETHDGTAVNLDTSALNALQAGYSWRNTALNRGTGAVIRFDAQVLKETHARADRAGFSVIALTSDLKGIELGFWENEIWAQNTGFTHAEGTAFDTLSSLTAYTLELKGDTYALRVGGAPILSGLLRDYSGFGAPYTVANFLFFGDDTTSASGAFRLAHVAANAPEPGTFALAASGLGMLGLAVRRRRATA